MCWISNNKPILKIAEEDIPVFKVMKFFKEGQLRSFYYGFRYTKGEIYHQPIGSILKDIWKRYNINEGFHSYSDDCKIRRILLEGLEGIIVYGPNKYYERLEVILPAEKENVKVNCIIPKGSEYYLSEIGTYVSNQIKIIGIKYVLENL